jgi:TolB-like protein/DNA-binding winged helix-turn-helix (wHTH) protein/Tfp pilus assembly protein PilF
MPPFQRTTVWRFGTYEVSLQSGELRKSGVKVRVQQQPMKLLVILLERPGEVVTREELRSRVWSEESFGDFDQVVNIAIAKLRSALGDSAENPRYIETLPKRGYRFIADVSVDDPETHSSKPEPAPVPQPENDGEKQFPKAGSPVVVGRRRWWSSPRAIVALLLIPCALILAAWFYRSRLHPSTKIRSLAVLPLESLSVDESQDYFADGMTDELITDLGQISALRVVSRTSVMPYKRNRKSLSQIARELNVDAVVEGTVLRSGDRVRITAQLIDAPEDKHLWAKSYEGDLRDTLALQKEVASAIAEEIRIELTPREQAVLKNAKPVNPEAYEAYLEGRYFWNKRTPEGLKKAVEYFNKAISKDPTYAQAYAGLADSYDLMGDWEYGILTPNEAYPKAKAAAIKALELDNTLSEAHTSLAFSMDVFDWNFGAAEREYKRAIELNPGYATAHHWYADHLSEMGRNAEAIAEMRKAENMDPLSLIISTDLAGVYLIAHLTEQAIEQSRKTVDMDPTFAIAHLELGQALVQKKSYREAIEEFQKAIQLSGSSSAKSNLAYAYAVSNQRNEALKILEGLKGLPNRDASEIALIYVGLGKNDLAMTWLEKAREEHFNPSILMRPAFDPLRSDPRFRDFAHSLGLPS